MVKRSHCVLKGYGQNDYYAKFDILSYHCWRETMQIIDKHVNLLIHSVAISEFPKWQTLFHLQKIMYI